MAKAPTTLPSTPLNVQNNSGKWVGEGQQIDSTHRSSQPEENYQNKQNGIKEWNGEQPHTNSSKQEKMQRA